MITMGGNAEIELIDSMDPFSEGELIQCWVHFWRISNPLDRRCTLHHASQKVVASHCQPVWWWKDAGVACSCFRLARLQAYATLLYGRNWCGAGFQKRLDCGQLYPIKNPGGAIVCLKSKALLIKESGLTKKISIVISLRNDMFELAHRLVGIYKTSNVGWSFFFFFHILGGPKNNDWRQFCGSVQRVLRLTIKISDYKPGPRDRLVFLPHRGLWWEYLWRLRREDVRNQRRKRILYQVLLYRLHLVLWTRNACFFLLLFRVFPLLDTFVFGAFF